MAGIIVTCAEFNQAKIQSEGLPAWRGTGMKQGGGSIL
jgi:hypothetical protein